MKKSIVFLAMLFLPGCGCSVVQPGNRGVKVHLGEVDDHAYPEGLVWHLPLVTRIEKFNIQQATEELTASCFSSDLQQVDMQVKVLYRLPEDKVVELYQKYSGNVFQSLVAPRIQESLKETTASETAEGIVKSREKIKSAALALAKSKVGDLVDVVDIVIENIKLSRDLEAAIESKMVQQQEAAKAEFIKAKTTIEAETALIKAKGEASAISVRGKAIAENKGVVDLTIAEKWDGKTPLVVGAGQSANVLLPIK